MVVAISLEAAVVTEAMSAVVEAPNELAVAEARVEVDALVAAKVVAAEEFGAIITSILRPAPGACASADKSLDMTRSECASSLRYHHHGRARFQSAPHRCTAE